MGIQDISGLELLSHGKEISRGYTNNVARPVDLPFNLSKTAWTIPSLLEQTSKTSRRPWKTRSRLMNKNNISHSWRLTIAVTLPSISKRWHIFMTPAAAENLTNNKLTVAESRCHMLNRLINPWATKRRFDQQKMNRPQRSQGIWLIWNISEHELIVYSSSEMTVHNSSRFNEVWCKVFRRDVFTVLMRRSHQLPHVGERSGIVF